MTPLASAVTLPSSAPAGSANESLRIDEFAVFLSDPEYRDARDAYQDGRYDDALAAFETALGARLLRGDLDEEGWFQLGHLRLQTGTHRQAAIAFERAAEKPWLLADYARYLAAKAHFDAGQAEDALRRLEAIPRDLPFTAEAELLRAELLLAVGRRNDAVHILRGSLQSEPRPDSWARAALVLSGALTEPPEGVAATDAELVEALDAARRVSLELAGTSIATRAIELETTILGKLSKEEFERQQPLSPAQQLVRLSALIEQRKFEDALLAADELLSKIGKTDRFLELDCEARLFKAKGLAGQRKWGLAVDFLTDAMKHCKGEDFRARLLFVAGKYAQSDKRYSLAVRIFGQLEEEARSHRLADDARLRRAQSYLDLGDEAKFTELLGNVAEDYPEGDVALDGVFDLAVRRIEKGDWSQAANVLERAIPKALIEDRRRDHEFAGRERYFIARAWVATGERERGFDEYAKLIAERPLSYYMLHAYSRLWSEDPGRAESALENAIETTEREPFTFPHRPEFETEAFQRALALARHGELDWAARELENLEGLDQPELLWAIALVYGRAGAAFRSHQLARARLTDWLQHWPAGDWRMAWELAFPRPYRNIVESASKDQGVPQALIYAVMREESAFRPDVVSHADAYGLMQLIKPTAKHFAGKLGLPHSEAALKRPSINIRLGTSVLSNYKTYFPNDPLLAIPGYNAGPGRPRRWKKDRAGLDFDVWIELIPFTETRRYTKRVLASRGAYAFLYDEPADPEALRLPLRFAEEP